MHYIQTIYLTGNNNPIISHCTKLIILSYKKVEQRRHEAGVMRIIMEGCCENNQGMENAQSLNKRTTTHQRDKPVRRSRSNVVRRWLGNIKDVPNC